MNYIDLPLKEALAKKFADGKLAHGNSDIFVGNPLEQLFQEMLDAMNYCDEIQKQFGIDMHHRRSQFWAAALEVQTLYRNCLRDTQH